MGLIIYVQEYNYRANFLSKLVKVPAVAAISGLPYHWIHADNRLENDDDEEKVSRGHTLNI